jgi:hypothetical protein
MHLPEFLQKIDLVRQLMLGRKILRNSHFLEIRRRNAIETGKQPTRTAVINYLLSTFRRETAYLEIGVRNPEDNFNLIEAHRKWSVDPGLEYKSNPVDFKLTSDDFFAALRRGEIQLGTQSFDVIFIDGLHRAEQVERDIRNALSSIRDDGFIVLHDCNPPSEWHARELGEYVYTPATGFWNGTTWKAFLKSRWDPTLKSCCVDADWGVGILAKSRPLGDAIPICNPYFEYAELEKRRTRSLNLISFDELKRRLTPSS